jgi:hypothetical protein
MWDLSDRLLFDSSTCEQSPPEFGRMHVVWTGGLPYVAGNI